MYRHLQAGVYIAPLCEGMALLTMHDDQYFLLNETQARALMTLLGGVPADAAGDHAALIQWTTAFEKQGLLRPGTYEQADPMALDAASRSVAPLTGFTGWRLNPEDLGPGLPLWLIARAWWAIRQSHRITARTRMPGLLRWLYGATRARRPLARPSPSATPTGAALATAGEAAFEDAARSAMSPAESASLRDRAAVGASSAFSARLAERARIAQSISALNRACLFYPRRTKCLEWSAALVHLCQRRGVEVDLVIGVSGGPFSAHAWVEHDGAVVGDDIDRRRQFAVIVDGQSWRCGPRDAGAARRTAYRQRSANTMPGAARAATPPGVGA